MKKFISVISMVLCFALMFTLVGCSNADNNSSAPVVDNTSSDDYVGIDMTVACLKGPTGVGMAKLMDDAANGKTANNYTFTLASAADEISGKIVNGEVNIASVPTNLAAKLSAKTEGKITMLAVNTLGVLSILENGEKIKSVADLKGKTIYSTGEGSNPEYILRYVLKMNRIDPDNDVTIKFVATNDELVANLVSGTAEIAMVPEPAATTVLTKKDTLRRALSISEEWDKISETSLMMGCVVALTSYVEANPEAVEKFLEEYEESIEYVTDNRKNAAILCEKHQIIPSSKIAYDAIPGCNVTFVTGAEMKESIVDYYQVLASYDRTAIGGKQPNANFYYGVE